MILFFLACQDGGDVVRDTACEPVAGFEDRDGDGFGGEPVEACDGLVDVGGDCDDEDAAVHPDAIETCSGVDDDCDGLVDDEDDVEGAPTWYADADQDGFGDGSTVVEACVAPAEHVADGTDCDDTNSGAFPGAAETAYDGVDQDCDGADWDDLDEDGASLEDDCDDDDPTRSWLHDEWCDDGVDNDCDGEVDTDCQFFGGMVSSKPWQTVYGEKETVACCGSEAGRTVLGATVTDSGTPAVVMASLYDGSDLAVVDVREGTSTTADAAARVAGVGEWVHWSHLVGADVTGDGAEDLIVSEGGVTSVWV